MAARRSRFPLEMSDGTQAYSLDDLKKHFDLDAVLGYYKSGKLLNWLNDRYLEDEAEAVSTLDESDPDFQKKLCAVFGVEFQGKEVNLEEIERRQERLKRLRQFTDEEAYIEHIDQVAFDQEELADLLDDGVETIYLCGEKFSVPVSQKGKTYIGINHPMVHISGKVPELFNELGLSFENCNVDNLPKSDVKVKNTDTQGTEFEKIESQNKENVHRSSSSFECNEIEQIVDSWKNKNWYSAGSLIFDTYYGDMDNIAESIEKRFSKSECERLAKDAVKKIYNEASGLFSTTSTNSLSRAALKEISSKLENDVSEIQHHIRMIKNSNKIQTQIDLLQDFLNLDSLKGELKSALDEELQTSYYSLYDFSYFLDLVEYESDDLEMESGFLRLFEMASASYSFDAGNAYTEITDDAQKYAETYEQEANKIARELLYEKTGKRIKEVLSEIRVILTAED